MKWERIIIFGFLCLQSCVSKPPLDKQNFQAILLQIHECQAYFEYMNQLNDSLQLNECKAQVLKAQNVTSSQYQASLDYYKKNPELLNAIYDSLLIDVMTYKVP